LSRNHTHTNTPVKRSSAMANAFSTASHNKKPCRSFTGNGLLLIVLFLFNLIPLAFPLFCVAEITPPPGEHTDWEIERLNKDALQLFFKQKRQEAIALWEKADALALNAKMNSSVHVDVLLNLGQAYVRMGSAYYPLAEFYLNRVIDIDPDRWDAYMILGDLCYDGGEPECAVGNYDLSLKLNPGYAHANTTKNRMEGLVQYKKNPLSYEVTTTAPQKKYFYSYAMEEEQRYYYFYLTFNRESSLTRIDIVREGEKRIHQTFKYEDSECWPSRGGEGLLKPADFNGHGNMDLKLQCMRSDGSSAGYFYFIFNRKKSMFIPFEGAMLPDSIPGPNVQEIRIFNNYGDAGQLYVESFYRVAAGKLVLMKEVKQIETTPREGKRYYKKIVSERSQEVMVVVNESLIEAGGK